MYNTNFIILASSIGYRMKTYEPRCTQKYRGKPLLHNLMDKIVEVDGDNIITLLSGFKRKKLNKCMMEYGHSYREVFNVNFENTSMRHGMNVALGDPSKYNSVCFIHSDIYFEDSLYRFDYSKNFFTTNPHMANKEVGLIANDGSAIQFNYANEVKWGKIANFAGDSKDALVKLLEDEKSNEIDTEIYNKLLDSGHKAIVYPTNGWMMELDVIKDLNK